jgi:hypothetical protein
MRRLFVCILTFLFLNNLLSQRPVSFPSEYIDFTIDSNYFTINGIYTFKNNKEKFSNINILFPFAVKTATIDSIRILNLNTLKDLKFKRLEQAISFSLQVPPNNTVELNIFYRQPTVTKNTYILTTTKSWGAALEEARYSLTTNRNLKIISFSFEPDSSNKNSINKTYYWNKKDFTPVVDFEVILQGK